MSLMSTAGQEAEALRGAVARGDFATAQEVADRYASLIRTLVAGLPPTEAARHLRAACDLLQWSRRNLCAARARLAEEIRRLDRISQYHARLAAACEVNIHH
jgi:hypothetical protein